METIFNAPQAQLLRHRGWAPTTTAAAAAPGSAPGGAAGGLGAVSLMRPLAMDGELAVDTGTAKLPVWTSRWAAIIGVRLHLYRDRDDATSLVSYALDDLDEYVDCRRAKVIVAAWASADRGLHTRLRATPLRVAPLPAEDDTVIWLRPRTAPAGVRLRAQTTAERDRWCKGKRPQWPMLRWTD